MLVALEEMVLQVLFLVLVLPMQVAVLVLDIQELELLQIQAVLEVVVLQMVLEMEHQGLQIWAQVAVLELQQAAQVVLELLLFPLQQVAIQAQLQVHQQLQLAVLIQS
jgi:hypothetical protein